MYQVPVVEIRCPKTGEKLVLNQSDYDPAVHALWSDAVVDEEIAKPLADMTVKELRAWAKANGVSIPAEATTKDQILAVVGANE